MNHHCKPTILFHDGLLFVSPTATVRPLAAGRTVVFLHHQLQSLVLLHDMGNAGTCKRPVESPDHMHDSSAFGILSTPVATILRPGRVATSFAAAEEIAIAIAIVERSACKEPKTPSKRACRDAATAV